MRGNTGPYTCLLQAYYGFDSDSPSEVQERYKYNLSKELLKYLKSQGYSSCMDICELYDSILAYRILELCDITYDEFEEKFKSRNFIQRLLS